MKTGQENRAARGRTFGGMSGNALKVLAMVTMLADHYAYVYVSSRSERELYLLLRGIGRLAFPIFCFLLVEGFRHTKNYRRYLLRMAAAAAVTEVFFDLAMYRVPVYWGYQSVLVTLLIGLAGLGAFKWCVDRRLPIYAIMTAFAAIAAGWLSQCDYGAEGVLLIFALYLLQYAPIKRAVAIGLWCVMMGGLELWGVFAVLPIGLYNGERGRGGRAFQYFGYLFYPLHLALLWLGPVMFA